MKLRPSDADGMPIMVGEPLYQYVTIGSAGFRVCTKRPVLSYPTTRLYGTDKKLMGWLCAMGGRAYHLESSFDITRRPVTLRRIAARKLRDFHRHARRAAGFKELYATLKEQLKGIGRTGR